MDSFALDPDGDLTELVNLHDATDARAVDGGSVTAAVFRATHLTPHRGDEVHVLGARDEGGRLTGFAVLEAGADGTHRLRVTGAEDAAARGAAVSAALRVARDAGASRISARAWTPDERILYHAFGFEQRLRITEMTRPLADAAAMPPVPDGVAVGGVDAHALDEAAAVVDEAYRTQWPDLDPWTAENLRAWAAAKEARYLGAWVRGTLTAVCGLRPRAVSPPCFEVGRFAVRPEAQRKGIGRALLRAGLHALAADGVAFARLSVFGHHPAAVGLYASEGFQATGVSWLMTVHPTWA